MARSNKFRWIESNKSFACLTSSSYLKNSFDFCSSALAKVDDSHLTESIPLFKGQNITRAGSILILSNSWGDHYSAQAMYLRLNGVLPPTAQPAAH